MSPTTPVTTITDYDVEYKKSTAETTFYSGDLCEHSGVTGTSATISWTGGKDTSYEVRVRRQGMESER